MRRQIRTGKNTVHRRERQSCQQGLHLMGETVKTASRPYANMHGGAYSPVHPKKNSATWRCQLSKPACTPPSSSTSAIFFLDSNSRRRVCTLAAPWTDPSRCLDHTLVFFGRFASAHARCRADRSPRGPRPLACPRPVQGLGKDLRTVFFPWFGS